MGDSEWYVLRNARVSGPYSKNQIGRYLLLGRIRGGDRLSTDGKRWQPLTAQPELIPTPLKSIETESGWRDYLRAKAAVDERGDAIVEEGSAEDRRCQPDSELAAFRREWRDVLHTVNQQKAHDENTRVLPLSLLLVLVIAIAVLLLTVQPV